MRFSRIVDFKVKLADKIKATIDKSLNDSSYTTFLKHFGEFKVAKIDKKEVSGQEFILDELKNIRLGMRRLERIQLGRDSINRDNLHFSSSDEVLDYCVGSASAEDLKRAVDVLNAQPGVLSVKVIDLEPGHKHLQARLIDENIKEGINLVMKNILPKGLHKRSSMQNMG